MLLQTNLQFEDIYSSKTVLRAPGSFPDNKLNYLIFSHRYRISIHLQKCGQQIKFRFIPIGRNSKRNTNSNRLDVDFSSFSDV